MLGNTAITRNCKGFRNLRPFVIPKVIRRAKKIYTYYIVRVCNFDELRPNITRKTNQCF